MGGDAAAPGSGWLLDGSGESGLQDGDPVGAVPPSFTCPACRRTSYNPHDLAHGYCVACHTFVTV